MNVYMEIANAPVPVEGTGAVCSVAGGKFGKRSLRGGDELDLHPHPHALGQTLEGL